MEGQIIEKVIIAMNPPDFDPEHVRPELVGSRLYQRCFGLIKLVKSDGLPRSATIDLSDQQIEELESAFGRSAIKVEFDRVGVVRNSFIANCRGVIGGVSETVEQLRQTIQNYFGVEARMSCLNCLARRQVCKCILT